MFNEEIKIRIHSPEHSKQVQEALFRSGYRWSAFGNDTTVKYTDKAALYANRNGKYISYSDEDYFYNDSSKRYVLHNGELVPADSVFVQPETPPMKEPSLERPPLGLVPKYVREAQRLQEVLEAMLRFSQAGKVIPKAWREELTELLCKQEMMEER